MASSPSSPSADSDSGHNAEFYATVFMEFFKGIHIVNATKQGTREMHVRKIRGITHGPYKDIEDVIEREKAHVMQYGKATTAYGLFLARIHNDGNGLTNQGSHVGHMTQELKINVKGKYESITTTCSLTGCITTIPEFASYDGLIISQILSKFDLEGNQLHERIDARDCIMQRLSQRDNYAKLQENSSIEYLLEIIMGGCRGTLKSLPDKLAEYATLFIIQRMPRKDGGTQFRDRSVTEAFATQMSTALEIACYGTQFPYSQY